MLEETMSAAYASARSRGGATFSWDTGAVPDEEQFAYWREVVWQAFLPLSPERPGSGPFAGAVRGRAIGPLTIARIRSQAQRVCRSPELIARGAGDTIHLNLQPRSAERRTLVMHAAGFTDVEIGERCGWTRTKVNRCLCERRRARRASAR
ncbi:MAG: hypothetical protein BGO11_07545 [Solirubrobacterales bacterium 70-9]|nr:MAG: hypothetical protein BGO11_07545 [Solirubrobacterales bacterium 70-9]